MINSKKKGFTNVKGFTIVELVIVIAVVAILAAVLIPTFSNLIKKANLNADQQTIRNMNTTLATYTDTEKEISDIMAYLRSNGFSYEKMVAYSKGYHYCYSKETNKMYLLDNKDEVVYPESINKDILWAAYDNRNTDIIIGIKNYYAITAVSNQSEFDAFFGNEEYLLDLNDNVCTVNGKNNVKVQNGYVIGTGFGIVEGADDSIIEIAEENNNNKKEEKVNNKITRTYTNVLNPSGVASGNLGPGEEITIEYFNCVFTESKGFYQNSYKVINLTFKNCIFIDINSYGLLLQPGNTDVTESSTVTVDGCEFINCNKGILISDWENTVVNVTNCIFALKTGNPEYNCFQIANYDCSGTGYRNEDFNELSTLKINFSNNKVTSANGVVYFHHSMVGTGAETDNSQSCYSLETYKSVLNFNNNQYTSGIDKIADRGEYKTGHLFVENSTAMQELAQLIK